MSNPNQNKPGGKSGQRSRKQVQGLSPKAAQPPSPEPGPQLNQTPMQPLSQEAAQPLSQKPAQPLSHEAAQPLSQKPAQPQSEKPVSKEPVAAIVAPANTPAVDFQTIATAYSDYSKKSFEQVKAYVEKLAGVRSLDKAIEVQAEFAKQAYETFVTDSQKIRGLYNGLARQSFKPLEELVAKTMPTAR